MANTEIERRWCRCCNASGMCYVRSGRWFCADCDGYVEIMADEIEFQAMDMGYRRAEKNITFLTFGYRLAGDCGDNV